MRVLVADRGTEADDFAYTVDGELVMFTITCDRDISGDGQCGCSRAFTGLSSRRCTSLARVEDRDLDVETLTGLIADSLTTSGWKDVAEWAKDAGCEVAEVAADYDVGTVLRRHHDDLQAVP